MRAVNQNSSKGKRICSDNQKTLKLEDDFIAYLIEFNVASKQIV